MNEVYLTHDGEIRFIVQGELDEGGECIRLAGDL